MKIPTKNNGVSNGWIIPVWNALTSDYRPSQVYVTAVLPGARKGPHLHRKRHGMFCCISGNADIITRVTKELTDKTCTNPGHEYIYKRHADLGFDHRLVSVPPGMVAEIIEKSGSSNPTLLINMPTPGWAENDQDEHEVLDWEPNV